MDHAEKYNRYELILQQNKRAGDVGPLCLTTKWPDGKGGTAYLYAKWSGGEQPKIALPVRSYSINPVTVPKRLHTSIAWMTEDFQVRWPDFFNTYRALGFNAVPFFPRNGLELEWVKKARDEGFDIIYNESPFHVMEKMYSSNSEIYAKSSQGTVSTKVSLAYRGQYYQKELERISDLSAKVRPDWIFFDNELFSGYSREAGQDILFIERLKKEGLPSISETLQFLGQEMVGDLYNSSTAWAHERTKPLVGQYNVKPKRVYHDILAARKMLPNSDIIPWLTAGTYGEFPSIELRHMVL